MSEGDDPVRRFSEPPVSFLRLLYLRPLPVALVTGAVLVIVALLVGPGPRPYGERPAGRGAQVLAPGASKIGPGGSEIVSGGPNIVSGGPNIVSGEPKVFSGGPLLQSVVRLADDRFQPRSPGDQPRPASVLLAAAAQFLLLELTNLEAPPEATAEYQVRVTPRGGRVPAIEMRVRGEEFRENYTLCLYLPAGTLSPGEYVLTVAEPAGAVLLESRVEVK